MKSSFQPQMLITPISKQQITEEDDNLPNPMLESILSQKSQLSYPGNAKYMKLILNLNRSDQRKDPFKQHYQVRKLNSESKKGSYQNQYKQMDSLLPQLKLVQLNQNQNKTECFNGEEVTIDQKVYFKQTNEILNIFQKAADGFTIPYEQVDDIQIKQMKKSFSIQEEMMKSKKAITTFKKAKTKLRSYILVSEVSKYTDEERKYKQQVNKMNFFLYDSSVILKSDHQLGEQIIETKSQSPKKDQISEVTHDQLLENKENENKKAPRRFSNLIQNSKIILKQISFIIGVFMLIFIMAYIKTLSSVTIHIEDL